MKNILTIFRKELRDITRDRRTLTVMLIIPLVVYPTMFIGISKYMTQQTEKAGTETLRIALVENGNASDFKSFVQHMPNVKITSVEDSAIAKEQILNESIDGAWFFPAGYDSALAKLQPTTFTIGTIYELTNPN